MNFISDFEEKLAELAKAKGADGIICGHIHKAEIREIDGLLYCNDGDWVESLSALVETTSGELKIIYWTHIQGDPIQAPEITLQPAVEALIKEAVA